MFGNREEREKPSTTIPSKSDSTSEVKESSPNIPSL